MSVFSVTSAMNVAFFAFAIMTIAVRAFDDASGAFGVMVAVVAGIGSVEQVAEDEEHGADEEWEGLHDVDVLKKNTKISLEMFYCSERFLCKTLTLHNDGTCDLLNLDALSTSNEELVVDVRSQC